MSGPVCACGCGKPLTNTLYWASDQCHMQWLAAQNPGVWVVAEGMCGPVTVTEPVTPPVEPVVPPAETPTVPDADATYPQVASERGWLTRALDALYGRTA